MPSDVLAKCSFVSLRNEDPELGFQRYLDEKRAKEIAEYVDQGFGTIPNSVVLSAQPEAALNIIGAGKTMEFTFNPKAFLIIDGQHRVYGYRLAQTAMRVPVVIYNKLSRAEETRLFIDINTKQRAVPSELLLDIKKLAEIESDVETLMREVFDEFNTDPESPLLGKLSPHENARNKISRVTFNSAVKPLVQTFAIKESDGIYKVLRNFVAAFSSGLKSSKLEAMITNKTVFRAMMSIFGDVARKLKDRHGNEFTEKNFHAVVSQMLSRTKPSKISNPGNSYKELVDHFETALKDTVVIEL